MEKVIHKKKIRKGKIWPQGTYKTIIYSLNKCGLTGSVGRYLIMRDEMRKFTERSASASEKAFRKELLHKFHVIQKKVECAHTPFQFILMAEYLLNMKAEGPIIQCGCFKGGSTAKLSLLAKKTQRDLFVCDSFQGLPSPLEENELLLEAHEFYDDACDLEFVPGEYKGNLEEVKGNIKKYGCLEVCEFIPGLFSETLSKLEISPAFVFIDVDFISSARDCLRYLWPRLVPNGYWFTHEARYPKYIMGILDAKWWHDTLHEYPPVVMGAGVGLSVCAPSVAYFRKLPNNQQAPVNV